MNKMTDEENIGTESGREALDHTAHLVQSAYRFQHRSSTKKNPSPSYPASNPASRRQQKMAIKRGYRSAKSSKRASAEKAAQTAAQKAEATAQKAGEFIVRHRRSLFIISLILILMIFLFAAVSSCAQMGFGGLSSVISTSYVSNDADLLAVDEDYSALELDLTQTVAEIENTCPGYDEYRYEVDEVGHNPYQLASYLTVKFGIYTQDSVQDELQVLFDKQYLLDFEESTEVRYRTENYIDEEGKNHTVQVPYDYHILTIKLQNKTLPAAVYSLLTAEQFELYRTILSVKGNKPYLWENTASSETTPPNDYQVPGEAMSDPVFAALIREAEKYLGFPYVWGGSTPETSFDCSGYICYIMTNSGVYNLPRTTATGIYNQCVPISREEARPGDLVFFSGTYDSPGPISHIGLYVGDGMMIHCGDPIQYASIETNYWKNHFYAFARLL